MQVWVQAATSCALQALTDHMCAYIELLGVAVVRHLPRLLRTLYHCVEWPDQAGEGTCYNCLRALHEVIRGAWPRLEGSSGGVAKVKGRSAGGVAKVRGILRGCSQGQGEVSRGRGQGQRGTAKSNRG